MAQPLHLPDALIAHAGVALGAPVVAHAPLTGGYTPQRLRRLTLADGRTAVLKAAPPSAYSPHSPQHPVWTEVLGREVRAYRELAAIRAWHPVYLGDFEHDGWVVLLMEDLSDADRVPPWTPATIDIVAQGLAQMHRGTLGKPRPAGVLPMDQSPGYFERLRQRGRQRGKLPAHWDTPVGWRWLDQAVEAGIPALEAFFGDVPRCLVHFDVRSDNIFIRRRRLVLIDWPDPFWMSPAIDSVYWALGVAVEGGGPAPVVHDRYRAYAPDPTGPAIRGALAFCAGYFLDRLQSGDGPSHVQAGQRRFLPPTLDWFAAATNLGPPPNLPPVPRHLV